MKTVVIQSYRRENVPDWIARCQPSVLAWSKAQGFDYHFADDASFALCGQDYLDAVGPNIRSITNLTRLLLCKSLLAKGYERAVWIDMDVLVFAPEMFSLPQIDQYAFSRETLLYRAGDLSQWRASMGVNNCMLAFNRGEPDLDFLIGAIRHVAMNRRITTNYQVGGDLIKGLFRSLNFQLFHTVGMLSQDVVRAIAEDAAEVMELQARLHQTRIFAANLCATGHYERAVSEAEVMAAMDRLEATRGEAINAGLLKGKLPLPQFHPGHTAIIVRRAPA